MKPKKIWANLAVSDLDRTTKFYTRLGFTQNGKPNSDLTSFLFGEDDYIMHFFLKGIIETNIKAELTNSLTTNEVVYTLSADTKAEVDAWAKEVAQAGGTVITQPEAFGQGYYGFVFTDPDGHRFNVFHM